MSGEPSAPPPWRAALGQLAARYGVLPSYVDWRDRPREADPEVLASVLRELGVPIAGPDDAEKALASDSSRRARDDVSPCAVARGGRPAVIGLWVAAGRADRYRLEIQLENGDVRRGSGRLSGLPAAGAERDPGGDTRVRRDLAIAGLPLGYHRARLEFGGARYETLIIGCPERAYAAPDLAESWAVFAPTYALRSKDTAGAGSLAELAALSRRVAGLGGALVGTLPLSAVSYETPFEPSPYSPISRLFWNELFIDLEAIPALFPGLDAPSELASARRRRDSLAAQPLVDYRAQLSHVRPVLEAFSKAAWESDAARGELEEFVRARPRVDDYARFRAASEHYGAPWPAWPEPVREGALTAADAGEGTRRYHVFCQYVLADQLAAFKRDGERAGLYLDLPVGVSRAGYDVFRERESFAAGCSVGAPPDGLFLGGQNWALPPLHPGRIRRRGYPYVIECFRAQLEHASALRVDHVMGLHRLYWIPEGAAATEGVYVTYPHDELYGILLLESHRQRCELIGEDLGTVPEAVRRDMARAGMGRLHVQQFSLPADAGDAPAPPEPTSTASFGTHDTPTFAGYWRGSDIDTRNELGLISDAEKGEEWRRRRAERQASELFLLRRGYARGASAADIMRGLTEYLAASSARVALVMLEDLWLETEPQNVPGTTSEFPNWRRRMARDLHDALSDPEVAGVLRAVDARRKRARRRG